MSNQRFYVKNAIGTLVLLAGQWLAQPVAYAANPYDPTDDLVFAFGTQCASTGTLTNSALAQSESLEGVISAIKNDPLCKGVSSDFLDADLQQNIQSKFALQTHQLNQQQLQGTIVDLTAAIQAELALPAPDTLYIETLQNNLYSNQAALLQSKQTLGQQKSQLSAAKIASISNHGTNFMDALASNSACLNAHPNALAQVGAQILKVSSNWAPGIMGSVMLATGGLIDHFVQAINTAGINRNLKMIANSRLQHAIGCTFEGLASTYCQSRDILLVQQANQKAQENSCQCDTVAEGVNLLSRDLVSFQDFVNNIYAGSKPSSPGTATEKIGVANLQAGLQNLGYTMDGNTAKYQKNYDTSTTQVGKDNAVRNLIRALSSDVKANLNSTTLVTGGSISTTGPIGDNFPDTNCGPMTYYYTNAVNNNCAPNANDAAGPNPCETCIARTYFQNTTGGFPPVPPITQLPTNSASILTLGATYVQQQELLYKQDNPQSALTSSETYKANLRSGRQFLDNASTYLTHLLNEQDGIATGQMLKSIVNAQRQINSVIKILDDSAKDPNSDPGAVNVRLEAILAPATDQRYIPAEIQMIEKQDIDVKMIKGKIGPTLAAVLQTSTSDSLSELLNNYTSLEALRNQVRDAKRITKDSLNTMGLLFKLQITDMARTMAESAASNLKDQDLKDDLSLFCMQTLLTPSGLEETLSKKDKKKNKNESIASYCKGQVYKSVYTKSGLSLSYDQLAAQPFESRACSLYDFYRKSTLNGKGVPHATDSKH